MSFFSCVSFRTEQTTNGLVQKFNSVKYTNNQAFKSFLIFFTSFFQKKSQRLLKIVYLCTQKWPCGATE